METKLGFKVDVVCLVNIAEDKWILRFTRAYFVSKIKVKKNRGKDVVQCIRCHRCDRVAVN